MKYKNVFWGFSLIIVGALLLARNFGWVDFNWFNFIRLWPLLFIFWGLSVLPVRENIKVGILIILLGGATWFVLEYPGPQFGNFNFIISKRINQNTGKFFRNVQNGQQDFSIPFSDSIKFARLDIDAAAGTFNLNDSTSDLVFFNQTARHSDPYKYLVIRKGDKATVKISETHDHTLYNNNHKVVTIALNKKPVWDINLDAGASAVRYDLSPFKVRKITLDGGAGSFKIKLGDKYPDVKVDIDAGASSITLKVPHDAGCDLEITAVMSGKQLEGFKKLESGHYQTENYDSAKTKIHLNVDAAVSSFRIIRY